MNEVGEELEEVKREIVESRSLIIKTNNLVNGLSADIHSISRRQQAYERTLRVNSVGFYVLVLTLVVLGAKLIVDARVESASALGQDEQERVKRLEQDFQRLQARQEKRALAERRAAEFYEVIEQEDRRKALDMWAQVAKLDLSRTERQTFERRLEQFKNELSLMDYHEGLDHVRARRWHEAEKALRRALAYKSDAAHAAEARFQLARALRTLGRQREAISLLIQLTEQSGDREVLDDATLLLADCQIDLEAWNDAKATLRAFLRRFPKSALRNSARSQLAKLNLYH